MTTIAAPQAQLGLFDETERVTETPGYYRDQIITCIGNKRSLLGPIGKAVAKVSSQLGKQHLRILDGFSGSGVVSRLFKSFASDLVVNDLESYSRVISRCYLTNHSSIDMTRIRNIVGAINHQVDTNELPSGFIARLYAPRDDTKIEAGERAFYTRENARRLDQYRALIGMAEPEWFDLLLGPLLASASVHANTAGVFKGFYKDRLTGKGKFGGSGGDALERITGRIRLSPPILSMHDANTTVYQMDTNELVSVVGDFDLAYFDPPYNQHPYGSNYFMLNLLVDYEEPEEISKVSGIPVNWNRSSYNQKTRAFDRLSELLRLIDARYVLLSFNDEGFVSPDQIRYLLGELGPIEEMQLTHNTFRGCRNLRSRRSHVTEHLYLLEKLGH